MKKNLRYLAGAAVGAVVALGFSSCAYDPYYSSATVGGSYSTGGYGGGYGYGDGYGYGGSGFSTSVFISTGDSRWGYDPTCYSYYDYGSRRYYDPYLYGYYPVGYRPPVVYGAPHPYGWRPGRGYIRPPGRINDVTVSNYRNRESRYRNSSYGWAKQVRERPNADRQQQDRQSRGGSANSYSRSNSDSRQSGGYSRESQSRSQGSQSARESSRPDPRKQNNVRNSSRYNTPVTSSQQQGKQGQRAGQYSNDNRAKSQKGPQSQRSEQPSDRSQQQEKKFKKDKNREADYR